MGEGIAEVGKETKKKRRESSAGQMRSEEETGVHMHEGKQKRRIRTDGQK